MVGKEIYTINSTIYISVLIYWITTGGSSYWLGSEGHIKIGNILVHLLFVHGFVPHYTDSIIGVEWYIGVLAIFYAIAPLLYKIINSLQKSIVAWVGGTFLCSLIIEVIYKNISQTADYYIYASYVDTFSIIAQFSVLLLGIVLFFALKNRFETNKNLDTVVASYALLFFAMVMIVGMARNRNHLLGLNANALFGIWFFILAYSQAMHATPIIDNVVFRYIGKHSYPIFLIHCLLILFYEEYVHIALSSNTISWIIEYAVVLGISAAISYPLTRFVEDPIRKILSNKLG